MPAKYGQYTRWTIGIAVGHSEEEGDGRVSEEGELRSYQSVYGGSGSLDSLDGDGDGGVSEGEFDAYTESFADSDGGGSVSAGAPDLHTAPAALPRWLLRLAALVFSKASLYKGKPPFLRVFFLPRTGQAVAWIYRLWTPNALRRALVAAKLPITSGPQYGESPCAGLCQAGSGLAVGNHAVRGVRVEDDMLAKILMPIEQKLAAATYGQAGLLPRLVFDYGNAGVYWEVGPPSTKTFFQTKTFFSSPPDDDLIGKMMSDGQLFRCAVRTAVR